MPHTVKVVNNNGKIIPTRVFVDDKEVNVRSVEYHADMDSCPMFVFEIPALTDIEVNHANLRFAFTPQTVTEAVKILRHELQNNPYLAGGFIASIESALMESQSTTTHDLAVAILNRIVGEYEEAEY
jgi:hypothetical protein